jgi:hypothetical protein
MTAGPAPAALLGSESRLLDPTGRTVGCHPGSGLHAGVGAILESVTPRTVGAGAVPGRSFHSPGVRESTQTRKQLLSPRTSPYLNEGDTGRAGSETVALGWPCNVGGEDRAEAEGVAQSSEKQTSRVVLQGAVAGHEHDQLATHRSEQVLGVRLLQSQLFRDEGKGPQDGPPKVLSNAERVRLTSPLTR